MSRFGWWCRAKQVTRGGGLAEALLDSVAEHASDPAAQAMGREAHAAAVDTFQRVEDFGCLNRPKLGAFRAKEGHHS